jgi:Fanconi anemia group A protein
MGCWVEGDECHLLSSQQRCKLAAVLQTASSLVDSLLFCPHLFLQLVVEQLPQVPLEVVWSVHAASLLSLEAILHDNPASVQYIVSALVDVSCKDGRDEGQKAVMQGVVQVLCGLILSKSAVALEVLQQLPAAFLAQPSPVHYSLVRAAVECPFITSSTTTELGSILLSACFAHPSSSLLEVIPLQTQWQYSTLPNSTVSLYSDLVLSLGSTHFVQLLQKALSVEQLNWPAILQAVACFLHSDSALDIFAGLVRNLVRRGLEDGDTHQLSCGLVLARQASLEGTHHFPPYHSWFQTMFGGGPDGVIGGKKQLLFLLKTLTGLVPHDPVFVLKAHITHPPRQLPRCLSQLKDYISLASTRLQDLGEKVPSAGSEDLEYDVRQ